MFVSTRAATGIQILSGPTSVATALCLARQWPSVAFRGLVEQTQPGCLIFGRRFFGWRNDANHFTGRHPVDVITWADMILIRDHSGYSNLIFRCHFGHICFRGLRPYLSKDRILVQWGLKGATG